MIRTLEYRLARQKDRQFLGSGERYTTKEEARREAKRINAERIARNLEPLTHVLTLPARDTDDGDPSHFIACDPL